MAAAIAASSSRKKLKLAVTTAMNWADLLPDILSKIAEGIHLYEDFVAFRGVCRSWRCSAIEGKFNPSPYQLPWLMLAEEEQGKLRRVWPEKIDYDGAGDGETDYEGDDGNDKECEDDEEGENDEGIGGEGGSDHREFFSLSKKGMIHSVVLPEARVKHCTASLGWLITIGNDREIELLHPLTRARIPLPHPRTFKYYDDGQSVPQLYIERATLSASPSFTNDYVLVIIVPGRPNSHLAYWRPGDEIWNAIESPCDYHDVIYYKNQFVTIADHGRVAICNFGGQNPDPGNELGPVVIPPLDDDDDDDDFDHRPLYLVESQGKLLAIARYVADSSSDYFTDYTYSTTHFRVFKFDGSNQWPEIHNLGGSSLFVGHSASFSCVAATYTAIKPNSIYFTDDHMDGYHPSPGTNDMGVYNLEDGTIEPHYRGQQWLSKYCPPLWLMPSF